MARSLDVGPLGDINIIHFISFFVGSIMLMIFTFVHIILSRLSTERCGYYHSNYLLMLLMWHCWQNMYRHRIQKEVPT